MNEQPMTLADKFESECVERGKSALLYGPAENGGFLLYVSKTELDPLSACMSACIDIMVKRGQIDGSGPVQIRKVADILSPGNEYFWSVLDELGTVKSGYARTKEEAKEKISEYLLAKMQPNS